MPGVIDLSLLSVVAVALGSVLLLRLAGGSMPWGHLMIAVGKDGRPMRPRVHWHLWSISHGEPPWRAALAGLCSVLLSGAALVVVTPRLVVAVSHPLSYQEIPLLIVIAATAVVLVPTGATVLVRGALDLAARRSSMIGLVVGLRRDVGLLGRSYRVAIQAGDRVMAKRLWAEAFRVDRATFERLSPGDRVSIEYSPHLRHVFRTVAPGANATRDARPNLRVADQGS